VSFRLASVFFTTKITSALIVGMAAATLYGQYPGQVATKSKDNAELRAIAVLEYTGDEGKPKTSRLVPITVYDGQALQDGNVYLARPQLLALAGEVEYELERNGEPIGLFDIKNSGQEQGSWVGYGAWKPIPSAKPAPPKPVVDEGFDASDDKPVLHRKHPDESKTGGSPSSTSSDSGSPAPPADPDRPTLHKKTPDPDSGSTSSDSASDPDRPTLHKKDSTGPGGPVLHNKSSATDDPDEGNSSFTDPDRPRLKRGKANDNGLDVLPSLMGLPPDMNQAVAVSDVKNRPVHPWTYTWANPDDETKMKASMESIARVALGLNPPSAKPAPKRATSKARAKPATPPSLPPELAGEQFRVFELAYGSGATLVLSAHTDAPPPQQKFVTLIAKPDLYGNVLVLFKNVTDGSHLDETPRMRLVDAVDALADNRGELLFELRGATQRQFALYRVLRGTAEKVFVSGGGQYGTTASE
jgi:hypothetical protein